tara:strand:+ start:1224 stop:1850 length:627 start_codon:yes stop_codon:yes gene_type:complete
MYNLIANCFFVRLKNYKIILISVLIFSHTNSNETLTSKIELLQDVLIQISEDSNQESNNLKKVKQVVEQVYNNKKMLKIIVGEKKWQELNDNEKEDLYETFLEYISLSYIKRFSKIDDPRFELIKFKKIGEKFNLVETNLIIPSEEKIMIHYLFSKVDNDWKVFDVLLEGTISEIATKKSEFKKIIDENGVSSLASSIRKKIDENLKK